MKIAFLFLIFFQLSGLCQEADDSSEDEILKHRLEISRQAESILDAEKAPKEVDLAEKIKESSLFDPQVLEMMKASFEKAKLWEKSPESVKELLLQATKGKWPGKVFQSRPKILDFFTDLLRDKKAVIGVLNILAKQESLKQYSLFWVILMLGTWFVKKTFFPPEPNFLRRSFTNILFSLFVSFLSLGLFFVFFKDDISPTVSVFARHFWF